MHITRGRKAKCESVLVYNHSADTCIRDCIVDAPQIPACTTDLSTIYGDMINSNQNVQNFKHGIGAPSTFPFLESHFAIEFIHAYNVRLTQWRRDITYLHLSVVLTYLVHSSGFEMRIVSSQVTYFATYMISLNVRKNLLHC